MLRKPTRAIVTALAVTGLLAVSCAPDQAELTTTTPPPLAVDTTTATTAPDVETTTTTSPDTTLPEPPVQGRAAEMPAPRTEVTGALWEGQIIVVGGLDEQGSASERSDIYDPETDTWTTGPALPVPLHHTAVATLGDRVYVVGGYSIGPGGWIPEAAVWSLGPGDDAWQSEPDLATARGALAVASTGEALVAVGGVGPGGVFLTSSEILEFGEEAWRPGPDLIEPREHLAAAAVDDEVYAIAGRTGGMQTNRSSVEVLRAGEWVAAPELNFSRGGIGATAVGDIPCVVGGEEPQGTIPTIECLVDGSWKVVAELDVARHGLAVVARDVVIHVIGGGPQPGLTVSGVHEVIPVGTD